MEEYRVEIKVKNNNILRKIEENGYKTVCEFCRLNDVVKNDVSDIGEFVNLKRSPIGRNGDFRPVVYRICEALLCSPEELFTDTQINTALESNKRTFQVNEAEMKFMLNNHVDQKLLEDIVSDEQKNKLTLDMLDTLKPREKKVIELRFGLNGNDEHTLKDTGKVLGVTQERIRQMESKAFRKLRHPTRSNPVRKIAFNE